MTDTDITAEELRELARIVEYDFFAGNDDDIDKVAAALRAYASIKSAQQGWQPIETCPRGDIEVLLAAYIIPSDAAQANGSRNYWTYGTGRHLWDDQWSGILGSTPSHWKPLESPK